MFIDSDFQQFATKNLFLLQYLHALDCKDTGTVSFLFPADLTFPTEILFGQELTSLSNLHFLKLQFF